MATYFDYITEDIITVILSKLITLKDINNFINFYPIKHQTYIWTNILKLRYGDRTDDIIEALNILDADERISKKAIYLGLLYFEEQNELNKYLNNNLDINEVEIKDVYGIRKLLRLVKLKHAYPYLYNNFRSVLKSSKYVNDFFISLLFMNSVLKNYFKSGELDEKYNFYFKSSNLPNVIVHYKILWDFIHNKNFKRYGGLLYILERLYGTEYMDLYIDEIKDTEEWQSLLDDIKKNFKSYKHDHPELIDYIINL
jgi:hypothetical protein